MSALAQPAPPQAPKRVAGHRLYRDLRRQGQAPARTVVAIGNFDGVHLGHRAILAATGAMAKRLDAQPVVYTFRPHPQAALRPAQAPSLLTTYEERWARLSQAAELGAVIEEPFSREFSTTSADRFFSDVLVASLGAVGVVVGFNFAFGRGREGDLERLGEFCRQAGVALEVVPPLRLGDDVVSSSRIRALLAAHEVARACELLGDPFFYQGVVVKGDGRGRRLGYPTANLKLDPKLELPLGVYATRLDGAVAITNIGRRPTFGPDDSPVVVETHVLDQTELDLYGRTVRVEMLAWIRDERRFGGVEELRAQIAHDIGTARALLLGDPATSKR